MTCNQTFVSVERHAVLVTASRILLLFLLGYPILPSPWDSMRLAVLTASPNLNVEHFIASSEKVCDKIRVNFDSQAISGHPYADDRSCDRSCKNADADTEFVLSARSSLRDLAKVRSGALSLHIAQTRLRPV